MENKQFELVKKQTEDIIKKANIVVVIKNQEDLTQALEMNLQLFD
jgi:hypothetical protein